MAEYAQVQTVSHAGYSDFTECNAATYRHTIASDSTAHGSCHVVGGVVHGVQPAPSENLAGQVAAERIVAAVQSLHSHANSTQGQNASVLPVWSEDLYMSINGDACVSD